MKPQPVIARQELFLLGGGVKDSNLGRHQPTDLQSVAMRASAALHAAAARRHARAVTVSGIAVGGRDLMGEPGCCCLNLGSLRASSAFGETLALRLVAASDGRPWRSSQPEDQPSRLPHLAKCNNAPRHIGSHRLWSGGNYEHARHLRCPGCQAAGIRGCG
jgi:hypothetical protein